MSFLSSSATIARRCSINPTVKSISPTPNTIVSSNSITSQTSSNTILNSYKFNYLSNSIIPQRRFFRHKGVLKLHCSECRYVVKRWHVPVLAVDCNANPRHKQAMTNCPARPRPLPDHLQPYLEGKQLQRHPGWKFDFTHTFYTWKRSMRLPGG